MPPWHIDKTIGIREFQNDRSLTDEQVKTIVSWVDAGAPMGDPKDMPPPMHVPRSERLAAGEGLRPARSRDQVAAVHARAAHAGQVVPAGQRGAAHRAALGARDRDQAVVARRPPASSITC